MHCALLKPCIQLGRTLSILIQVTQPDYHFSEHSLGWFNVFHITDEVGQFPYIRIPSVSVKPTEAYIRICSEVSGNDDCQVYNYNFYQRYHFEIKQDKNSNGEVVYSIGMDGATVYEVVNTLPKIIEEVALYGSDPWHPNFARMGELRNLDIANGNRCPA